MDLSQIRRHREQREADWLSPYATKAAESTGREVSEDPDDVRTCFQVDRDRILHSKAFRRLKHKTQVFIAPEGDHYRTRLTHTLDVAQVARTIGGALRLNEDLIEAIALGHDVGHTPFGHAGEYALDEAVDAHFQKTGTGPDGFYHHVQSLRVLQVIEPLNLTEETTLGIGGHSKGSKDLTDADGEVTSTLEAAVVRISDRIAYLNHDIDDALRSKILPELPAEFSVLGRTHAERIRTMMEDVITHSVDSPAIRMSAPLRGVMNRLKDFLFENVYYRYPLVTPEIDKAKALVGELFWYYLGEGRLAEGFDGVQGSIDYVSGMTDRFAIETFRSLRVPLGFPT